MSDEDWIERLKLLKPHQIADLYEALGDYWQVMPDGMTSNEIEAEEILKSILVILAGGRV